jgi:hypothetical protein
LIPRATTPPAQANHSRVIWITGPVDIVTEERLTASFNAFFVYQTDEVIWLVEGDAINMLERRFGSYRCQVQWAFRNLTRLGTRALLLAASLFGSKRGLWGGYQLSRAGRTSSCLLSVVERHISVTMET